MVSHAGTIFPMQKTMYLLAALLLTALAAAACAGGQEVPPPASVPAVDVEPVATAPPTQQPVEQTAVLEIRATDAPPEGVTKILITAGQIQVQQSGEDDESGWHTVVPGPVEFDLVAITGVEEVLGSRELAPGRYGQVRLDIQSVEVPDAGRRRPPGSRAQPQAEGRRSASRSRRARRPC